MEIAEEDLYKTKPSDYGPEYKQHLLEQYKLYVEMADRISARRQTANSFFLSINTVLIAFIGIVADRQVTDLHLPWVIVVSVAGLSLCYAWYRLIRSYKDINTVKFKVIHAIEAKLPSAPFDAEWKALGEGENRKLHIPFTHVETYIPMIFALLYIALIVVSASRNCC